MAAQSRRRSRRNSAGKRSASDTGGRIIESPARKDATLIVPQPSEPPPAASALLSTLAASHRDFNNTAAFGSPPGAGRHGSSRQRPRSVPPAPLELAWPDEAGCNQPSEPSTTRPILRPPAARQSGVSLEGEVVSPLEKAYGERFRRPQSVPAVAIGASSSSTWYGGTSVQQSARSDSSSTPRFYQATTPRSQGDRTPPLGSARNATGPCRPPGSTALLSPPSQSSMFDRSQPVVRRARSMTPRARPPQGGVPSPTPPGTAGPAMRASEGRVPATARQGSLPPPPPQDVRSSPPERGHPKCRQHSGGQVSLPPTPPKVKAPETPSRSRAKASEPGGSTAPRCRSKEGRLPAASAPSSPSTATSKELRSAAPPPAGRPSPKPPSSAPAAPGLVQRPADRGHEVSAVVRRAARAGAVARASSVSLLHHGSQPTTAPSTPTASRPGSSDRRGCLRHHRPTPPWEKRSWEERHGFEAVPGVSFHGSGSLASVHLIDQELPTDARLSRSVGRLLRDADF